MLVKVKGNRCLVRNKENHFPTDPPFEMEDAAAVALADEGLLEIVDDVVVTDGPLMEPEDVLMGSNTLEEVPMAHEQIDDDVVELSSLTNVTDAILAVLVDAGIDNVELLAAASAEDLVALKGIGSTRARRLIEEAEKALE